MSMSIFRKSNNNYKNSLEEQSCEEFFTMTTWDKNGIFDVFLPFKDYTGQLRKSFKSAQERFFRL